MPTTLERKMIQKDLQREIEELRRENIFLENRILDVIETKSQPGSLNLNLTLRCSLHQSGVIITLRFIVFLRDFPV